METINVADIRKKMDETLKKMREAINAKDELGITIFSSQYAILEELLEVKGE